MNFDEQMMQRCIDLAQLGLGTTYPNPLVGCVIVYDGKIIGEGWHRKAGEPHAEVLAISSVTQKELLKDSCLYVSLEPCAHFGKTPPCADLIVSNKIPKVIVGTQDPFSKVNGLGIAKLRNAGIEVKTGVLERACQDVNKRFFIFHKFNRPYVILKWAETVDGFMATSSGKQKWITNSYSKQLVHKWRAEEQAILVGTETAIQDNPQLNVRLWSGNNPIRIVLDRNGRLDKNSNLFDGSQRTLVFTELDSFSSNNSEFIQIRFDENLLKNILLKLHELNIQSIVIEGGKKTLTHFIEAELWDEARIFSSDIAWDEGVKSPEIVGRKEFVKKVGNDCLTVYKR